MKSKVFWHDTAERAVRTFAQSLLGVFVAGVTILSVDWIDAFAISATATLVSVLMSVAGGAKSESPSYVPEVRHPRE